MGTVRKILHLSKISVFVFLAFFGCSAYGGKGAPSPEDNGGKMNANKIDPSLLAEIERLKAGPEANQEIDVLIRTKKEIDPTEREAIEKQGGRVGSVLGNILTARVPAGSVKRISDLDFVLYIERSKKERTR